MVTNDGDEQEPNSFNKTTSTSSVAQSQGKEGTNHVSSTVDNEQDTNSEIKEEPIIARIVDKRFWAKTQNGKDYQLRIVKETFCNTEVILGLQIQPRKLKTDCGKKDPSNYIVRVGNGNKSNEGLVHFNIVKKVKDGTEADKWVGEQSNKDRWGFISYGGKYGYWIYDRYTSPAELVNYNSARWMINLRISGPQRNNWESQDKVWLKPTKNITHGLRLYTSYGTGSTHHLKIANEIAHFETNTLGSSRCHQLAAIKKRKKEKIRKRMEHARSFKKS